MKLHRDRDWDKGVHQIDLSNNERLIIKSKNGMFIMDERGKDLNIFMVEVGELSPPFWIPDDKRVWMGRLIDGKYISPVGKEEV